MYNRDSVYYAEKINVLGTIGQLDFIEDTITLVDEAKDTYTVKLNEVQELKSLGKLKEGIYVYEHDVIMSDSTGKMYEIKLNEDDDTVHLEQLNDAYEFMGYRGSDFDKSTIGELDASLVGNIYQLRKSVPKVNFNIAIIRESVNGETNYFYAGNNKNNKTIDMIKAVYMGGTLLEEEEYERVTLTYEQLLDLTEKGQLKKVDPQELRVYIASKAYQPKNNKPVKVKQTVKKCACNRDMDDCMDCDEEDCLW